MNQPPDINQYRPPKRHGGWIAVIIVTALVVALVIVARRVTVAQNMESSSRDHS